MFWCDRNTSVEDSYGLPSGVEDADHVVLVDILEQPVPTFTFQAWIEQQLEIEMSFMRKSRLGYQELQVINIILVVFCA